jgi:hypothetical protein
VWEYVSEDGEGGHLGKVRNQTAVVLEGGEAGEVGSVSLIYRAELVEGEQTALNLTHVSVACEGVSLTRVGIDLCSFVFVSTGPSTSSLAMLDEMVLAPLEMSSTILSISRSVPNYLQRVSSRRRHSTHFNDPCHSPTVQGDPRLGVRHRSPYW